MLFFAILTLISLPVSIFGKEIDICGENKEDYIDPKLNLLWVIKHQNNDKRWYASFMDETSYYNVGKVVMGHKLEKGPAEAQDDFEPFHIYDHSNRKKVYISANGHVRTFKDHINPTAFGIQHLKTKPQPYDDKDLDMEIEVLLVGKDEDSGILVYCWPKSKEQSWAVLSRKPIDEEEQIKILGFLKNKFGFERKGYSFNYKDTNDD